MISTDIILRHSAFNIPAHPPMPDIVANLLHLSSEAADLDDLLEPALDLVLTATNAEAAAIARAAAPNWTIQAARGTPASAVPLDLAAEALERDTVVAANRWLATPLNAARRDREVPAEAELVLLIRGNCPEPRFAGTANGL